MKARRIALEILERGLKNSFLHREEWVKLSKLDKRDRDFIRKLVYGTVRFTPALDENIEKLLKKPSKTPEKVKNILRMGAYEILFLRIPSYASVNEYTALAPQKMKGLVNAVLRKVSRECLPLKYSFSRELDEWLKKELGNDFHIFLEKSISHSLSLRSVKISREYLKELLKEKVRCRDMLFSSWGLVCDEGEDLQGELFEKGFFTFQDESSQLVTVAIAPHADEIILDACGGVGTKTSHIVQISPESSVVYNDINADKQKMARRNFKRMGLFPSEMKEVDLLKETERLGNTYDKILLDAPCSALGTVGKHPDVLLRFTPEKAHENAEKQLKMLNALWPFVKRGGYVVYSVCTITEEETNGVVSTFLNVHEDAKVLYPFENLYDFDFNGFGVQLLKYMEGFYIAKIAKV